MRQRSWWGVALTGLVVLFIAWFTLRPSPEDISKVAQTDFLCLYPCGEQELRDSVLNIVLFMPLGFALAQWLPGWAALLLCVAATCGIEYTQWGWLAGRDASLRDLLTNTLAAVRASGWRADGARSSCRRRVSPPGSAPAPAPAGWSWSD